MSKKEHIAVFNESEFTKLLKDLSEKPNRYMNNVQIDFCYDKQINEREPLSISYKWHRFDILTDGKIN